MNIFKKLFKTLIPSVSRFFGVFLSSIASAVLWAVWLYQGSNGSAFEPTEFFTAVCKSSLIAIAFSIAAGFGAEYFLRKKSDEKKIHLVSLISQFAAILISYVPMHFLCVSNSGRSYLILSCIIAALLIVCGFFLCGIQNQVDVIPNIIVSGLIAGIVSGCVTAGVCLILFAINELFVRLNDCWVSITMEVSSIVFFVNFFMAYVSKRDGTFLIPKAFKIIVEYVLFPLYLVLILVLYCYLVKSAVMRQMPVGQINWFVSFATFFYLFFHLALKKYSQDKFISFFFKAGYFIIIPLVIIQVIRFFIRVNEFGFTPWRVASLAYIFFSCIAIVLTAIKSGKFLTFCFPIFSLILILISCTPLNVFDVSTRSQIKIINKVLSNHGYTFTHDLRIEDDDAIFSDKEKSVLCGSLEYFIGNNNVPEWLSIDYGKVNDFCHNFFGFNYSRGYGNENNDVSRYIQFRRTNNPVDVSGYKYLREIIDFEYKNEPVSFAVYFSSDEDSDDKTKLDITEYILPYLEEDKEVSGERMVDVPLIIQYDSMTKVVIKDLYVRIDYKINPETREEKVSYLYGSGNGYVLLK